MKQNWKKKSLMVVTMLSMSMGVMGQKAVSTGVYREKSITREDGTTIPAYVEHYKVLESDLSLDIAVWGDLTKADKSENIRFRLWHQPQVLETEVIDTASHEIRNIDVTKNSYKVQWFNDQPRYSGALLGTWVTEQYEKSTLTPTAQTIINTLTGKNTSKAGKFAGAWKILGFVSQDGKRTIITPNGQPCYKFHGDDVTVQLFGEDIARLANEEVEVQGLIRKTEYLGDDLVREQGNPCIVRWIGRDMMEVSYVPVDGGRPLTELWLRTEIPTDLKQVFQQVK